MSVENDEEFNLDTILRKLDTHGKNGFKMKPFAIFLFEPPVAQQFERLNREYRSKQGNVAYDRRKLYFAMSYGINYDVDCDLAKMADLCRTDKILGDVLGEDFTPVGQTFNNFLANSNRQVMKTISLCSVMDMNDLELLDFTRIYTDSTDALINGSIHYKISRKEVEYFKLMNEWNLLHNGSVKKMKRNHKLLMEKQEEYADNEEICESIDEISKKFSLYDKIILNRLDRIEEFLDDNPDSEVCIMFPEAAYIKTKRGKWEFALLVQNTMMRNGIMLNTLAQSESNDSNALEEIIEDLRETFNILLDLQVMYGEKQNYKEIYDALNTALHILDSGYFTDNNLEVVQLFGLNVLIMPRGIARYNNDKLKNKIIEGDIEKIIEKYDAITMYRMKSVFDGFECPYNQRTKKGEPIMTNSKFNRERSHLDDVCKEYRIPFHIDCPADCPLKSICDKEDFEVKTTLLRFNMYNKFVQKRYREIYKERLGANEQIQAFLKTQKGILKLPGSNKKAAQNLLYIKQTSYNINRKEVLKGTAI